MDGTVSSVAFRLGVAVKTGIDTDACSTSFKICVTPFSNWICVCAACQCTLFSPVFVHSLMRTDSIDLGIGSSFSCLIGFHVSRLPLFLKTIKRSPFISASSDLFLDESYVSVADDGYLHK
jgi:hypothetical protein